LAEDRRLYIQDTWASNSWYDVSSWVDILAVKEAPQAEGGVSQLDVSLLTSRVGDNALLPITPAGGMEVVYFVNNAFGTNLHDYRFAGRIVLRKRDPVPSGASVSFTVESFERDLNAHVPYIAFTATAQRYDTSRIQDLIENHGYLAGTWDAHTYVSGPFVDYLGTSTQGWYRTSVYDIIKAYAADPGTAAGVTYRRWYVTGEWSNPAAIGTGNLVRMFHYYAGLTGPQEPLPLTDGIDRTVIIAQDAFSRSYDANRQIGQAPTGNDWQQLVGIWNTNGSQAYLEVASAGHDYAAVIDGGTADVTTTVKFAALQTPIRLVYRATSLPLTAYKWEGWIVQATSTDYAVYKYQGGVFTNVGGIISTVPVAGDTVKVITTGATHKIYVNNVLKLTLNSQTFNQTATLYGLGVQATGAARFDDFNIVGLGTPYFEWHEEADYSGLTNCIAIAGPGADPVAPDWTNTNNVSVSQGRIIKTDVPAFQTSHVYSLGERVRPAANPNGRHYRVTTSGTSAATEPAWPLTEGTSVTSGTATFICETWDSGAASTNQFTEDGGYVATTVENNTLVTDSFARSPGALVKADSGQQWKTINGTWFTDGTQAYCTVPGLIVVDSGVGSAAIVQATATVAPSGWRLAFRVLDANNAYWVLAKGAGAGTDVVKWQAGVATVVLHVTTDIANGSVVKVLLVDDTISLYIGGVFRGSVSGQTFLMGATQHGISCATGATTSRWSNFSVVQNYTTKIIGLGFADTSTAYSDVEFGWYFDGVNKNAQPMENGVLKSSALSALVGDSFKVEARQVVDTVGGVTTQHMNVTYWRRAAGTGDWVLAYTSLSNPSVSSATPLYVDTAFYHVGALFASVQVRRFTYGVYRDTTSVATYGPMWAKELLQDDTLDSPTKRQNAANALFARYGYPRISLVVRCLKQLHQGRRILVNNTRLGITNQVRIISKVEVEQPSSQVREYTVTLGDRPYEYGDEEPLGYLLKIPDRDSQAPTAPSSFTAAGGTRSGLLIDEKFTWARPSGSNFDAAYIEIYVEQVGVDPAGVTRRFPAANGNCVWTGLTPRTFYTARALFRDWSNNASPMTDFIEFTTPGIPLPLAPVWHATPFPAQGVVDGRGWVDMWFLPVDPVYDPAIYNIYYAQSGADEHRAQAVATTSNPNTYRLTNLVPNVQYTVAISTTDSLGVEGKRGSSQSFTIVPVLPNDVPNGGFEETVLWDDVTPAHWNFTLTGGATEGQDTSVVHEGQKSLKLTVPVGGSALALSEDFALPATGWYSAEVFRYVSATAYPSYPKLQVSLQILDSTNTLYTEFFMGVDDSPLNGWASADFGPPGYAGGIAGTNVSLHGRIRLYISGVTVATTVYFDSVRFIRGLTNEKLADAVVDSRALGSNAIDSKNKFASNMVGIQKGSSNPVGPSTDDRNFRLYGTTGDRDTYWNGAYWVSTDLKSLNLINDAWATAVSASGSNVGRTPHNGDLDWWLARFSAALFIASTNDASNFWTLQLRYITAGNTITNVASMTTAAIAPNTWNRIATNTFSPATAPITVYMFEVIANKTGSPGTLLCIPQLSYREIT
jgi:hypothetical protein